MLCIDMFQKRVFVALDFRPKLLKKQKEKAANIETFGKIMIKLFQRWDLERL